MVTACPNTVLVDSQKCGLDVLTYLRHWYTYFHLYLFTSAYIIIKERLCIGSVIDFIIWHAFPFSLFLPHFMVFSRVPLDQSAGFMAAGLAVFPRRRRRWNVSD